MANLETVKKALKSCRLTLLFDYNGGIQGREFAVGMLSEFHRAKRIVGALSAEEIDGQLSACSEVPEFVLIDKFNVICDRIADEVFSSQEKSDMMAHTFMRRRQSAELMELFRLAEKYDTNFLVYFTADRPGTVRSFYFRIPEQHKNEVNFLLYTHRYKPASTEVLSGAKLSFEFGKDAFDYILIDYDEDTEKYKEVGLE